MILIGLKYKNLEIRDAISSIQSAPVIVNDDFIDGRKSAELIQEANPGFTIGNLDVSQDLDISSLLAQLSVISVRKLSVMRLCWTCTSRELMVATSNQSRTKKVPNFS